MSDPMTTPPTGPKMTRKQIEKLADLAAKDTWASLQESLDDLTMDDEAGMEEEIIKRALLAFYERTR